MDSSHKLDYRICSYRTSWGKQVDGLAGVLASILGILLASISLFSKWANWKVKRENIRDQEIKELVRDVMITSGLIKEGDKSKTWPNGSTTLPDFLGVLWECQEATQAEVHALREKTGQWHTG